jgi:hypothetical protein
MLCGGRGMAIVVDMVSIVISLFLSLFCSFGILVITAVFILCSEMKQERMEEEKREEKGVEAEKRR